MAKTENPVRFALLQILRIILGSAVLLFVGKVSDLGTPIAVLLIAVIVGTLGAGSLLRRGLPLYTVLLFHFGAVVGWIVLRWLVEGAFSLFGSSNPATDFAVYRFANHVALFAWVYGLTFAASWFFWTSRAADTIEAILIALAIVWLLSGHRNYQLDAPKNISELAFQLSAEPQHLLLGLGLALTAFLVFYFAAAHRRPLFRGVPELRSGARIRWPSAALISVLLVISMGAYTLFVNQIYTRNIGRASEGVGQNDNQGESPLTFNSAVGQTKQPAAIVRLETDFPSNPWKPMIYLRESALSEFNGREFVLANGSFDRDVPPVPTGQPFKVDRAEDDSDIRERVVQSIYLLTQHTNPFALDRLHEIKLLKNPDPKRFFAAYQAESLAPTSPLDSLIGEEVGNPDWDVKTREHYLRAPGSRSLSQASEKPIDLAQPSLDDFGEDLRYYALGRRLTEGMISPVEKATAIIKYLSDNSIYTRSPGHQTTGRGDPVAPYLFADEKRGYCVHFSHAAVYLLRLAGIPARIATGYLTDMSYAKDGHILLHVGDRHAWPEIYVRGQGWMVADISPARAENEQAIIPDEKLLDELMNKLDPAEELIAPPQEVKERREQQVGIAEKIFQRRNFILAMMVIVSCLLLGKALLWFGYLLAKNPSRRVRYAYAAFESRMIDLGHARQFGETRREYARRLFREKGIDALGVALAHERLLYSRHEPRAVAEDVGEGWKRFRGTFGQTYSRLKRAVSFLNPVSLFIVRWRL